MLRKTQLRKFTRSRERGVSLPEMALSGVLFFTLVFGIIEMGRMMVAYNALSEAARRGARYAATQNTSMASQTAIKNLVVYGNTAGGGLGQEIAPGLTTGNVFVTYSQDVSGNVTFGLNSGNVKVEIKNYRFNFNVPLIGSNYLMKPFSATANGENAGIIPGNI